jgi:hypothetical protein
LCVKCIWLLNLVNEWFIDIFFLTYFTLNRSNLLSIVSNNSIFFLLLYRKNLNTLFLLLFSKHLFSFIKLCNFGPLHNLAINIQYLMEMLMWQWRCDMELTCSLVLTWRVHVTLANFGGKIVFVYVNFFKMETCFKLMSQGCHKR